MKLWALLFGLTAFAQTKPDFVQDRFENLDFAAGAPGLPPPGWHLGQGTADTIAGTGCRSGKQCATVRSAGGGPAFLYQIVDATPYRGKRFTFRAAVRAEVSGTTVARILVRVHRDDGGTSFFNNLGDHPITYGRWLFYEIAAPIESDSRDIEFGMQLIGPGSAWIDNVSVVFGKPRPADEDDLRALVRKLADARNAGDGAGVAALYSEAGEWSNAYGQIIMRGREALSRLWTNLGGHVERSIESIDFLGGDVAMVRVTLRYADPPAIHHESLLIVKENGAWLIRAHQSAD